MVSATDPYGRILGTATISSKQLLNFTHEAEWTHYSENLVAQVIQSGALDL
jgi:hypothetical protein